MTSRSMPPHHSRAKIGEVNQALAGTNVKDASVADRNAYRDSGQARPHGGTPAQHRPARRSRASGAEQLHLPGWECDGGREARRYGLRSSFTRNLLQARTSKRVDAEYPISVDID